MNRREFIKATLAAMAAVSLPISIDSKPVVYYMDLAIVSLKVEKAIVWGNPQKQATVALSHQFTLLRAAEGKTIEEQWRAEVQKATGLEDFELKPHPLQEQLEKRLNEPFGDDSPGMMAQAFGGKYL